MPLTVEVEELASWLRISSSESANELTVAATAAAAAIESFCGWTFDEAATTETARVFPARWADLIYIDPMAVDTGLAIAVDTSDDGTFNQTWAAADYQLEPLNQRRAGLSDHPYFRVRAIETKSFPIGKRATVQVTARWGWTTVPEPVQAATLMHAARLHARRNTVAGIATGEALPTRMAMGLDADVRSLLMPYQRQDLWQ